MENISCIKCKRWKLFNDKACTIHPDFKTEKELAVIKQREEDAKLMEPFDVLMFAAAIRVAQAFGNATALSNIAANLNARGDAFTDKVAAEVRSLGPLSAEEAVNSMLAYSHLINK